MTTPPDPEALLSSGDVRAWLGNRIEGLARLRILKQASPGGFYVYEVSSHAGSAIVRIPVDHSGMQALRREERLVRELRPRVALEIPDTALYSGSPGLPAFAIHTKVKGRPLTSAMFMRMAPVDRRRLVDDLVGFMLSLHTADLDRACLWCGDGCEHRGSPAFLAQFGKPGWFDRDLVERSYARLSPHLGSELSDVLAITLAEFEALDYSDSYLRLVHGDIHGYNLAMRKVSGAWRLTGVFDFGTAGVRDVHEDLFRLNFVDKELVRDTIADYNANPDGPVCLNAARIVIYYRAFLFYLAIEKLDQGDIKGVRRCATLLRGYLDRDGRSDGR